MTIQRRALLQLMLLGGVPGAALADSSQPIRIVVPYAAGGQTDAMARLLADHMSKTLARTVIVDNRPGAAGLIGTRYVQLAPPDGDTLVFHNAGIVSVPMLTKAANYDAIKDFDPVAETGVGPNFLMVTESVPARTFPEFLAWGRAQTKGVNCANSGINSGGHISALLLEKMSGVKMVHVPFKGSSEVTKALIQDEVQMQVSVTTDSLNPYIKAGKIRILAVATKERTKLAPEVPAISELLPGYAVDGWFGILAPAKTPLARREQLAAAIKAALDEPAIQERFKSLFMEVVFKPPTAFADDIVLAQQNFRNIVATLGLTAQ